MKKLIIPILLTTVVLAGCGSSSSLRSAKYASNATSAYDDYEMAEEAYEYDMDEAYPEATATGAMDSENYGEAVNDYGKKLVHNYDINIQTQDFDNVVTSINAKITEYNGYIESSNMNNYDDTKEVSMTIRIPQENAVAFMEFAGQNGNVVYQSENTVDKTLDYVDIDSRMKSYKQELEVMEGLAKKADTVSELIEIENNIAQLRGQIDSYQSQLNSIDNRVSFATIQMNIREVERYTYVKPSFWTTVTSGLADSFERVGDMVSGFIIAIPIFVVGLILLMIPVAVIALIVIAIVKAILKHNAKKAAKVNNAIVADNIVNIDNVNKTEE